MAGFSFQGTEGVGLAAAEAADPQRSVPQAIRSVFLAHPHLLCRRHVHRRNRHRLQRPQPAQGRGRRRGLPPFTPRLPAHSRGGPLCGALDELRHPHRRAVSRECLALRVLPACCRPWPTGAPRPPFFGKLNRRGVPVAAVVGHGLVGALAFLASTVGEQKIYQMLYNASGLTGFIIWLGIAICHLLLRRAWAAWAARSTSLSSARASSLSALAGCWGSSLSWCLAPTSGSSRPTSSRGLISHQLRAHSRRALALLRPLKLVHAARAWYAPRTHVWTPSLRRPRMQIVKHPLSPRPGTQRELVSLHYGTVGSGGPRPWHPGLAARRRAARHAHRPPPAPPTGCLEAGAHRGEVDPRPHGQPHRPLAACAAQPPGPLRADHGRELQPPLPRPDRGRGQAVESRLGPDAAANVKLLRTALRQAIEASPAETELQSLRRAPLLQPPATLTSCSTCTATPRPWSTSTPRPPAPTSATRSPASCAPASPCSPWTPGDNP